MQALWRKVTDKTRDDDISLKKWVESRLLQERTAVQELTPRCDAGSTETHLKVRTSNLAPFFERVQHIVTSKHTSSTHYMMTADQYTAV
jgi:hypothetical protein